MKNALLFCLTFAALIHFNLEGSCIKKDKVALTQEASFVALKSTVTTFLNGSWCSSDKATLIMDLILTEKLYTCVEIGVFTGSTLLPMAATLKHLNQGMSYGIDPWSNDEAVRNLSATDPNRSWWQQVNMDQIGQLCFHMLNRWQLTSRCTLIKKTSEQAVNDVPTIDFLHLDGNYSRASSLQDAKLYLPKVRQSGYILISNLYMSVDNTHPKTDSFYYLLDTCDVVCEVDQGNTILLQKL